MAQAHKRERSRWLVIRRSSSKPKRDEVVARIPEMEWYVARDVCLRKYGVHATLIAWAHASAAQRKAAELLPVTYVPLTVADGHSSQPRNKPLARGAGGRR